ncbi:MAG: hypothetical protein HOI34_03890, partial [Rhodospirillaceae bacterium]|nr:hypothetical protein [Rhodospirillaceae bacterium]
MNIKPVLGPVAVAAILFAGDALAGTSQGLSNVSVDVSTALLNDDSAVRGGVRKRIDDITVLPQEDVIDFGDDLSQWALDGECDDPRFVGAGMTWTPMLDEDAFHDASDCRAQFDRDMIALAVGEPVELLGVRFGDNSSQWSYDGECDDPRFEGAGMVHATPLDEDLYRDAGDCSDLYLDSMVELVALGAIPDDATVVEVMLYDGIDFGDDHSEWSLDGECDDPRFAGPGMTATLLLDEDTYHDATDCRDEYADGRLWFA